MSEPSPPEGDTRWSTRWDMVPGDYVSAHRHLYRRTYRRVTVLLGVVYPAAAGVAALGIADEPCAVVAACAAAALPLSIATALWLPRQRALRAIRDHPEAYPMRALRLEATEVGLRQQAGGWLSTLSWAAVADIELRRRHLYLYLSEVQAVVVPRRALGGPEGEATALARLRSLWRGPLVQVPGLPPADLQAVHSLEYVLEPPDFIALQLFLLQRHGLRGRPAAVALAAFLAMLLALVTAPWVGEGGAVAVALTGAVWLGMVAVLAAANRWVVPPLRARLLPWRVRRRMRRDPGLLPTGPCQLLVGASGAWMRTPRGVARFTWADASEVVDAGAVCAILFGGRAVVVPSGAFAGDADRAAFLNDTATWIAASPRGMEGRAIGPRRPAPSVPPGPFAPPAEHQSSENRRRTP